MPIIFLLSLLTSCLKPCWYTAFCFSLRGTIQVLDRLWISNYDLVWVLLLDKESPRGWSPRANWQHACRLTCVAFRATRAPLPSPADFVSRLFQCLSKPCLAHFFLFRENWLQFGLQICGSWGDSPYLELGLEPAVARHWPAWVPGPFSRIFVH